MANIALTQKDSVVDELEQIHQRLARRAYDLFRSRGSWGDAIGDWLRAEEQLVSMPAVELREQDGMFTLAAALPGVDAKAITVDITPQDVVIKASERTHTEDKGEVHRCEFTSGEYFRSLPFPKAVDPKEGQSRVSERDVEHHRADRSRGAREARRCSGRLAAGAACGR